MSDEMPTDIVDELIDRGVLATQPDEPTPTEEADREAHDKVEAMLHSCLSGVPQLALNPEALTYGTAKEMAGNYAMICEALDTLTMLKETVANELGQHMRSSMVVVDGIGGFQRDRRTSEKWDNEGVRSLLRRTVLGVAADPETGEVQPHDVELVDSVLEAVQGLYSLSSPKVGGLKALDADPDEYRTVTKLGYRVKYIPTADSDDGLI